MDQRTEAFEQHRRAVVQPGAARQPAAGAAVLRAVSPRNAGALPPQEHFDALRPHFDDKEIVELTLAVAVINAWNRISVSMQAPVAPKPMTIS